jgi:hypothetical protein
VTASVGFPRDSAAGENLDSINASEPPVVITAASALSPASSPLADALAGEVEALLMSEQPINKSFQFFGPDEGD